MRVHVWKESLQQLPAPMRRLIRLGGILIIGQIVLLVGYGIYRFSVTDHPSKLFMIAAGWVLLLLGIGTLSVILFYPILSWIWTGRMKMVAMDSDTEDWTLPTVLMAVFCGSLGYALLALQGIGTNWFTRVFDWFNQLQSRL